MCYVYVLYIFKSTFYKIEKPEGTKKYMKAYIFLSASLHYILSSNYLQTHFHC